MTITSRTGFWSDPKNDVQLIALWAEGVKTNEIGRRMGISKNATVGRAHRLGLLPRPSPIKRDAVATALLEEMRAKGMIHREIARATGMSTKAVSARVRKSEREKEAAAVIVRLPTMEAPVLRLIEEPFKAPPVHKCQWPLGEPGTKAFRLCGDPARNNRPYCSVHCALAYVPLRERREAVA